MKTITTSKGSVQYLNSGDWIENLSALEYNEGSWALYKYNENEFENDEAQDDQDSLVMMSNDKIFDKLLQEFIGEKKSNESQ